MLRTRWWPWHQQTMLAGTVSKWLPAFDNRNSPQHLRGSTTRVQITVASNKRKFERALVDFSWLSRVCEHPYNWHQCKGRGNSAAIFVSVFCLLAFNSLISTRRKKRSWWSLNQVAFFLLALYTAIDCEPMIGYAPPSWPLLLWPKLDTYTHCHLKNRK